MTMLGYRDELEGPELGKPQGSADSKHVNLIVGVVGVTLLFLLEVLSWFTERGGLFSIISALFAVHEKPPLLDIDENALRFPIIIAIWLMVVGFSRLFDFQLDMSKRRNAWLPILIIIGGGFVVDGVFGESIITHYMAGHGYSRCEAGDWAQGNGKSRVWFADYALRGVECRQRTQTVPERSLFQ
jgi:hypothetical protein